MASISFTLVLLQLLASVGGSAPADCNVNDSCDAFSMIQSKAHAYLSADHYTVAGGTAEEKLASLMGTIEQEVVNLKVGDPLPPVVNNSLNTIRAAIDLIEEQVDKAFGNKSASLERLATAFQVCINVSTQSWPSIADGANPLQQESDVVSTLKNLHAECRVTEVGAEMTNAIGEGGACDTFIKAIKTLESIKPARKQTELTEFFEEFDETLFSQKATACDSAVKSYNLTVAGCTTKQIAFEKAVCHWHTSARHAENACEAIRSCREVDGKLLEEECAAANNQSIAWKAEEIAIKQIKCLLEKLFAGEYDQIKTCSAIVPVEGEEDYHVTCPTVTVNSEEEAKCSNLVKPGEISAVPGSDTWDTTYSSEDWYPNARTSADSEAKIEAQVQCELPEFGCPEGKVPNADNTACEAAPTTTTTEALQASFEILEEHTFDGSGAGVETIKDPGACSSGDVARTVMFWFKVDWSNFGLYAQRVPFCMVGPNPQNNKDRFCIRFFGGSENVHAGVWGGFADWHARIQDNIQNDQWQHFALTYTGSQFTLFIDRVQVASGDFSHTSYDVDCSQTSIQTAVFGQESTGNRWKGDIRELRVWNNVALSAVEIQAQAPTTVAPTTTAATTTTAPEDEFEYIGRYDGICQRTGSTKTEFYQALGLPGHRSQEFAEKWCNQNPMCLGFGRHYDLDRYYMALDATGALLCPNYESNSCGDGQPTNGCYVKFRKGSSTPYSPGRSENTCSPECSDDQYCDDGVCKACDSNCDVSPFPHLNGKKCSEKGGGWCVCATGMAGEWVGGTWTCKACDTGETYYSRRRNSDAPSYSCSSNPDLNDNNGLVKCCPSA